MQGERSWGVLITGCSSGIGRALAQELARVGHRVVASARRPESLEGLKGMAARVALDVTDLSQLREAVAAAEELTGGLHMVVNNAGFGLMGPAAEVPLDVFRSQLETNVVGALAVIQAALPAMMRRGCGQIVNVGSVSGVTTTPFAGAYCASKAALHSLDEALRMELRPFGIQVVCVQPGAVRSSFADTAGEGLERYAAADSAYARFAEAISRRARSSQHGAMESAEFSRLVVRALCSKRPPAVIRAGRWSRLLPFIGALPRAVREPLLARKFGLGSA